MITLTIDHHRVEVKEGATILDACAKAHIEIPVFCYHPKLSIAGNCRMCLVEIEGHSKLVASCAFPAQPHMVVSTLNQRVQAARKGNLEFLLINHPLDCPICDQGGECDLQDISYGYGALEGQFKENKRAVLSKDFGPFIKTSMTRCILCTRCVRFAEEVAGVSELGVMGRGELSEISMGVEKALVSEMSGNMIDVCPVGALSSKPNAFKMRSWELKKTESIDCLDAVGSNIRIDTRGPEVMRILPRRHDDINECWISDKTRFFYDGLKYQRLDTPYIRGKEGLKPASWKEALKKIQEKMLSLSGHEIGAIVGHLGDVESAFVLKHLMQALGSENLDCCEEGARPFTHDRSLYLFNTSIAGIEASDACLLVGTNPRFEATMINARLRKRALQGNFEVGCIGECDDLIYPVTPIDIGPRGLEDILTERHPWSRVLKKSHRPMVILGTSALMRPDRDAIQILTLKIAQKYGALREDWRGYNVLHTAAGRVGALDVEFLPGQNGKSAQEMYESAKTGEIKLLYLLGAEGEMLSQKSPECCLIYQGHHGDEAAQYADVILPGSTFTEKNATYVNTEGRVQRTTQALLPPGEAKEDWKIVYKLAEILKCKLPYETLTQLHISLFQMYPWLEHEDSLPPASSFQKVKDFIEHTSLLEIEDTPFVPFIKSYYMTDSITRASPTLAHATRVFHLKRTPLSC